jgi:glycosyltransferase involved in cell wall biosynthesis
MSSSKNRILIVIPSLTLGGAEKQAFEYAKALIKLGCHPVVLGMGRIGELEIRLKKEGIEFHTFSFHTFFTANKLRQVFFLVRFIFFLRKLKCKKVIPFTYWPNVILRLVYKFSRISEIYWNQRSVDSELPTILWERLGLKFKSKYIANSIASATSISIRHHVDLKKIAIIYNVMELSEGTKSITKSTSINIVMVANFFPEKDHETVLLAFNKIIKDYPDLIFKLHLVGASPGKSPKLLEMKSLAFDLNLCGKVIFYGVLTDVKQVLSQMDLAILSTFSEGFSNAIMEYMDGGLPIIATDIPANIEALTIENQQYLFPISDEHKLTKLISRFVEDHELRNKVGARNKELANLRFNQINLLTALKETLTLN